MSFQSYPFPGFQPLGLDQRVPPQWIYVDGISEKALRRLQQQYDPYFKENPTIPSTGRLRAWFKKTTEGFTFRLRTKINSERDEVVDLHFTPEYPYDEKDLKNSEAINYNKPPMPPDIEQGTAELEDTMIIRQPSELDGDLPRRPELEGDHDRSRAELSNESSHMVPRRAVPGESPHITVDNALPGPESATQVARAESSSISTTSHTQIPVPPATLRTTTAHTPSPTGADLSPPVSAVSLMTLSPDNQSPGARYVSPIGSLTRESGPTEYYSGVEGRVSPLPPVEDLEDTTSSTPERIHDEQEDYGKLPDQVAAVTGPANENVAAIAAFEAAACKVEEDQAGWGEPEGSEDDQAQIESALNTESGVVNNTNKAKLLTAVVMPGQTQTMQQQESAQSRAIPIPRSNLLAAHASQTSTQSQIRRSSEEEDADEDLWTEIAKCHTQWDRQQRRASQQSMNTIRPQEHKALEHDDGRKSYRQDEPVKDTVPAQDAISDATKATALEEVEIPEHSKTNSNTNGPSRKLGQEPFDIAALPPTPSAEQSGEVVETPLPARLSQTTYLEQKPLPDWPTTISSPQKQPAALQRLLETSRFPRETTATSGQSSAQGRLLLNRFKIASRRYETETDVEPVNETETDVTPPATSNLPRPKSAGKTKRPMIITSRKRGKKRASGVPLREIRLESDANSSDTYSRRTSILRTTPREAGVEEVWNAIVRRLEKILGPENQHVLQAKADRARIRAKNRRDGILLDTLYKGEEAAREHLRTHPQFQTRTHPQFQTLSEELKILDSLMNSDNSQTQSCAVEKQTSPETPAISAAPTLTFPDAPTTLPSTVSPTDATVEQPATNLIERPSTPPVGASMPAATIPPRTHDEPQPRTPPAQTVNEIETTSPVDPGVPFAENRHADANTETAPWTDPDSPATAIAEMLYPECTEMQVSRRDLSGTYSSPYLPKNKVIQYQGMVLSALAHTTWRILTWLCLRLGPVPIVDTGKVRVRWTCRCGEELYDDFVETRPGAAEDLQKCLNHVAAYTQAAGGSQQQTTPSSSMNSDRQPASSSAQPSTQTSWSSNSFSSNTGRGESQQQLTSPHGPPLFSGFRPYYEPLWLLTCAHEVGNVLRLSHRDMSRNKVQSDRDMAVSLRKHYWQVNSKWYRIFRLRSLSSIEFVQFEVHRNRFADVRKKPDIPPAGPQHTGYLFERGDLVPPVGSNYLLHMFKHPYEYDDERIAYDRTPKKSTRLDRGVGWGIILVEDFDAKKVFWLILFLFILSSLVFGIAWTVFEQDIQGAFGVSSYIVTTASLLIWGAQVMFE